MQELKFGERIYMLRKSVKCNQKEFCQILDVPQSTLSAYETDKMQPTISTLVKIAETFKVSVDWLCGIGENSISSKHAELNTTLAILGSFFEAAERNGISAELSLKWNVNGSDTDNNIKNGEENECNTVNNEEGAVQI